MDVLLISHRSLSMESENRGSAKKNQRKKKILALTQAERLFFLTCAQKFRTHSDRTISAFIHNTTRLVYNVCRIIAAESVLKKLDILPSYIDV